MQGSHSFVSVGGDDHFGLHVLRQCRHLASLHVSHILHLLNHLLTLVNLLLRLIDSRGRTSGTGFSQLLLRVGELALGCIQFTGRFHCGLLSVRRCLHLSGECPDFLCRLRRCLLVGWVLVGGVGIIVGIEEPFLCRQFALLVFERRVHAGLQPDAVLQQRLSVGALSLLHLVGSSLLRSCLVGRGGGGRATKPLDVGLNLTDLLGEVLAQVIVTGCNGFLALCLQFDELHLQRLHVLLCALGFYFDINGL